MLLYELPDAKIEEVGAHFGGLLEGYDLLIGPNLFGLNGHVGDDLEVRACADYELEDCLERRMVQTGKEFAGLNRLQVSRENIAVTIRGLVESCKVFRDLPIELDVQGSTKLAGFDLDIVASLLEL